MRIHWRAALLIALFTAAVMATAQTAAPNRDHDITRTELNNFDHYLDTHPQVSRELKANPALINDPAYLRQHPGLQQFLNTHPGVREEARENPNRFMNRERVFDAQGRDVTQRQAGSLDTFLDTHPDVATDLRKNPSLANNPKYLASHPGFKDYLEDHPQIKQEFKENPKAVLRREKRYEHSAADKRQDRHPRRNGYRDSDDKH